MRHSCSDLRAELPIAFSALADIQYSYILPPPPRNFDAVMGFDARSAAVFESYNGRLPKIPAPSNATTSNGVMISSKALEGNWLFYMTDIILSRMNYRIMKELYEKEQIWGWRPDNLFKLLRSVNEFDCKLDHWYVLKSVPFSYYILHPTNHGLINFSK